MKVPKISASRARTKAVCALVCKAPVLLLELTAERGSAF